MLLRRFNWTIFLLCCFFGMPSFAFSGNSLWDYVSTHPSISLDSASPIFSFTTPASSENKEISIGITFYSSDSSPSICTGSLYNNAYNNVCVCPGLAGRTFYISQDNLYKIINAFSPGNISNVACARIRDNKNFSSLSYTQTACSSGTMSCSNPSGSTTTLPVELTLGNSCTC